jgi:uncharacterized membrane protein
MGGWAKTCGCSGLVVGVVAGMTLLAGVAGSMATAQTPSLTLIEPPAGRRESFGMSISADGSTAVGWSTVTGRDSAFSWTRSGGLNDFGSSLGTETFTRARGVSANGSTIVGARFTNNNPGDEQAFRYFNGTFQSLGPSPNGTNQTSAYGVSGNGSVIVGYALENNTGYFQPMRWTEATGMRNVGLAGPQHIGGYFTGVSRDGSTAIGISGPAEDGIFSSYRWTEAGGWSRLPRPAGFSSVETRATGVNFDGSLVTGYVVPSSSNERRTAVLWRNGQPEILGAFSDRWNMYPQGVSDSGAIIVGGGVNVDLGVRATVWFNGGAAVSLQDYLASLGVVTPAGWTLWDCHSVSSDGRTITGIAADMFDTRRAFVATIPGPASALSFTLAFALATRRRRPS